MNIKVATSAIGVRGFICARNPTSVMSTKVLKDFRHSVLGFLVYNNILLIRTLVL